MATKIGPKTVTQRDRSKNLVFCVDAAHSDSYGGEPADNLFADPNNFGGADWNVKNGTWAAYSDPGPHGNGCYSCTATDSDPYAYSNYVRSVSTGNLTFSAWVKGVGGTIGMGGDIRINFGSSGGQATGSNELERIRHFSFRCSNLFGIRYLLISMCISIAMLNFHRHSKTGSHLKN